MEINPLNLLILGVCLALSFLLSGMEAGVFALSRLRIRQQLRAGRTSARLLHGFLENPENFLWTILIGNTLANFAILGFLIAWLHQFFAVRPVWFGVALAAAVFLFYTLSDLLPKMLFRLHPNRFCIVSARPFRLIHLALRPLVRLVEWLAELVLRWTGGKVFTGRLFGNREELRLVMQESAQALTSEERAMINRVLDLQNLTVRQIVMPLAQALTVGAGTPMSEVIALGRDRHVTRFPVVEGKEGESRVVGLINLGNLIYEPDLDLNRRAGDYVKPALYVTEDLRLEVALQRLQRSGQRLAIVLGRDQRETGILGLEDILGVIFGEVKL
jgi:putative hemolysin